MKLHFKKTCVSAEKGEKHCKSKITVSEKKQSDIDVFMIEFTFHKYMQHFFFFLIVCFTSYFVFSIAVLPHSPGVVYYHLMLR